VRKILANRLSRNYINSLPVLHFTGQIVMVDRKKQAQHVLQRLLAEKEVGFDTESRPSFQKHIRYPISVIQIATESIVYLFQVQKTGFVDDFFDFFTSSAIKKIGIDLKSDTRKLLSLEQFIPHGFVDLSRIAGEKGIIQVGARALTARYLEHRIVKRFQKTNWALPHLNDNQILYAATDAWICLKLYPILNKDRTNYRLYDVEYSESDNYSERDISEVTSNQP
jgi:ribonuclease D